MTTSFDSELLDLTARLNAVEMDISSLQEGGLPALGAVTEARIRLIEDRVEMVEEDVHAIESGPKETLLVKRLSTTATLPTYGSDCAAGLDLYADFGGQGLRKLKVGERAIFETNIAISPPDSTYGRIAPRSGLALKKGVEVLGGVVDEDYRGSVGVILINLGEEAVTVQHGDRIAQMIITPYIQCEVGEVNDFCGEETNRGDGGFGSTGA